MAPSKQAPGPPFAKDEKVLCFHGDLMYEAKVTEVRSASDNNNTNAATIKADDAQYKVHYKGWKASWDDWVSQDRIRKFNDDNKALATQLQSAARLRNTGGSKSAKKAIGKAVGAGGDSEMSSARGSEERAANNSYAGRGPRRGRDYELENVSCFFSYSFFLIAVGASCQPTRKHCSRRTGRPCFGVAQFGKSAAGE
ncbi:chromo domain-like protein [Xylariales sp. AK1849]|nr:chromo domain-like protein [Xylariales sp. AK1849]